MTDTMKKLSQQRLWQLDRIAKGLCEKCGDTAKVGRQRCQPCLTDNSNRSKARYLRLKSERLVNEKEKETRAKSSAKRSAAKVL